MDSIARKVFMVKPVNFAFNEETAVNNYYQKKGTSSQEEIQKKALAEFINMQHRLEEVGIDVKVLEDRRDRYTPDSIFPNNWFTTHEKNTLVLYPMFAENRRLERRDDVQDFFLERNVNIIDYSPLEHEGIYLEGTGAMVLDRKNKKAYCALSPRADEDLLDIFCKDFSYKKVAFHAFQTVEGRREEIYHTNVMMAIGMDFAIVCAASIAEKDRERVLDSLKADGKELVIISEEQVEHFAGNCLELENFKGEHYCVLSKTAYEALTTEQKAKIERYATLLPVDVTTIETYGGGSARCMMAELYV